MSSMQLPVGLRFSPITVLANVWSTYQHIAKKYQSGTKDTLPRIFKKRIRFSMMTDEYNVQFRGDDDTELDEDEEVTDDEEADVDDEDIMNDEDDEFSDKEDDDDADDDDDDEMFGFHTEEV
jgi:hypothetical protein